MPGPHGEAVVPRFERLDPAADRVHGCARVPSEGRVAHETADPLANQLRHDVDAGGFVYAREIPQGLTNQAFRSQPPPAA